MLILMIKQILVLLFGGCVHNFGQWQLTNDRSQIRRCSKCGFYEAQELIDSKTYKMWEC